jgi:hypothetical protein
MAFSYEGYEVFEAEYVREQDPTYFAGCNSNIRNIISLKQIPDRAVLYEWRQKSGARKLSTAKCKSAILLLKKWWVNTNVPAFKTDVADDVIAEKLVYKDAPSILQFKDDEKFHNKDGEIQEIEVRGERAVNKCYFRATDVEKMLHIEHIRTTLINPGSSFVRGKDYVTLIADPAKGLSYSKFATRGPTVFLTYCGLIQVLFIRRHPIAKIFQNWATSILFATHFNLNTSELTNPTNVMNLNIGAIYEYWKQIAMTNSVVYLFKLGQIKNLRKSLNIDIECRFDDEDWVVKFGKTEHITSRIKQHRSNYERFEHVSLNLVHQSRIDMRHLTNAENQLSKYFEKIGCLVSDNNHYRELAIVSDMAINTTVSEIFDTLENESIIHTNEAIVNMEAYHKSFVKHELSIAQTVAVTLTVDLNLHI